MLAGMQIVIISGLSGSGKSIALNILEDAAYYCVDNLPSPLLQPLVDEVGRQGYDKVAVAIDIRAGESIDKLPQQLADLRARGFTPQFIFLDAKTETLLLRYSETRRRHPLAAAHGTLAEAIAESASDWPGWPNLATASTPVGSSRMPCATGSASSCAVTRRAS